MPALPVRLPKGFQLRRRSRSSPSRQYYAGKEDAHKSEREQRGNLECGENRRFLIFFYGESRAAKKQNVNAAILAALQNTTGPVTLLPAGVICLRLPEFAPLLLARHSFALQRGTSTCGPLCSIVLLAAPISTISARFLQPPRTPMSASPTPRLTDAFDARVTAFRTDVFSMAEDLDWLDRLRIDQAPVGVILHGTRILEVLTRKALALAGFAAPREADSRHASICWSRTISSPARSATPSTRSAPWATRPATSSTRSASRTPSKGAYAILLRGMHWYFGVEFKKGPRPALHRRPQQTARRPAALQARLPYRHAGQRRRQDGRLPRSAPPQRPRLAAAAVSTFCPPPSSSRLLDGGHRDEARAVLTAALGQFPDEVRLRQLQGLLWSRSGRLEEACAWLEAIETTDSEADEETQGILAGAYKRRGDADPARAAQWRQASHLGYERGWQRSQGSNTYLGINAAATASWARPVRQDEAHRHAHPRPAPGPTTGTDRGSRWAAFPEPVGPVDPGRGPPAAGGMGRRPAAATPRRRERFANLAEAASRWPATRRTGTLSPLGKARPRRQHFPRLIESAAPCTRFGPRRVDESDADVLQ